jgi:hypothetical protein
MGRNLQRRRNFARAENLDWKLDSSGDASLVKRFRRDLTFKAKFNQLFEIHHFPRRFVYVCESSLVRKSLLDRKLTAFESWTNAWTRTRLLTLGPAAGGLTVTATLTATDSLLLLICAFVWTQVVQTEWHSRSLLFSLSLFLPPDLTGRGAKDNSFLRFWLFDPDEVTDLGDHASN